MVSHLGCAMNETTRTPLSKPPPRAPSALQGAGLGLRRGLLGPLEARGTDEFDFLEIAPENWMGVGGRFGRRFRALTEGRPVVAHGLSLSLGGPAPLDRAFLERLGAFLDEHGIEDYTEHLSACGDHGQLYDLMPVPFTEEAVRWVAGRVRQVQEILERRIALENVSYYAAPGAEPTELEFVCAVLEEADCDLLLDVNNIVVNAVNHRYDARAFLAGLPGDRTRYVHVAGHYDEAPDLKIDTHGAAVPDPVWSLLDDAYDLFGVHPTLVERDFNFPPLEELAGEVERIRAVQAAAQRRRENKPRAVR
jgi:uncharacterized protein (UPF0276 family)